MGHLATRARAAGILSLCLLLSSFGARATLGAAAPPDATVDVAPATIGSNSCQGPDACLGATGDIGNNSCNGDRACEGHPGDVGDNSCTNYAACVAHTGDVGDNSCNGYTSCGNHKGNVGNGSCNGDNACESGIGSVGNYSCNGDSSCRELEINIDDCEFNIVTPAACNYRPDARIRFGSGTFVGNHIYNLDAFDQNVLRAKPVNEFMSFFIQIVNTSPADLSDSFKVKRSAGFNNGFRVRYYDATGADVTWQVTLGTFTTPVLDQGEKYTILAKVKVRPQATECSSTTRLITVSSVDSGVRDTVRFTAGLAPSCT